MSAANSPGYTQGAMDGQRDCEIVANCPPGVPLGPNPPYPAYPVMYNRGYEDAWSQAAPHAPCPNCRKQREGE